MNKAPERWRSGWRLLLAEALFCVALFIAGGVGGLVVGGVHKALAAPFPAGMVGNSCVVTVDGWGGSPASLTWTAGGTKRIRAKCSIGPAILNTAAYTNWRGDTPGPNCSFGIPGFVSGVHSSVAAGGQPYWSNWTNVSNAGGIKEFYYDVYTPSSGTTGSSAWVDGFGQWGGGSPACTTYVGGKVAISRTHTTDLVNPSPSNPAVGYPTAVSAAAFAAASPAWVYNPHDCANIGVSLAPDPIPANSTAGVVTTGLAAAGLVLEVKRPASSTWQAVSPVPGSSALSGFPAPTAASSVVFRCKSTASPSYVYQRGSSTTSTAWVTTEPVVTACALATLSWPGNVASSTTAAFKYVIPSGVTIDALQYAVIDPNGSPSAPTSSTTWTSAVAAATGPSTSTINVTVVDGVSMAQVWWRCKDLNGWTSAGQYAASFALGGGAFGGGDGSCWDSGGIGLAPSSWVPGLLHGMGCLAQDLFVPSDETVTAFADDAMSVAEKAPLAYLVETGTAVAGVASSWPYRIEQTRNTCFVFPGMNPADTDASYSACPSDFDDAPTRPDGDTAMEWYRRLIGWGFWVGAFWTLWLATRKVLAS